MNCTHCGAPLTDGAQFCPHCGARSPRPKRARRTVALVLALSLVLAASAGFAGAWLLRRADIAPAEAARSDEAMEDAAEKNAEAGTENAENASQEQVLLAAAAALAQKVGQGAGSSTWLTALGLPDEAIALAPGFTILSTQPVRARWCSEATLRLACPELFETASDISVLAPALNNTFGGSAPSAASSALTEFLAVKLPEALDEPLLFVLEYASPDGEVGCAFVSVAPAGGKLAVLRCAPVLPDALSGSALDSLSCWETADADAIDRAAHLSERVSLRATAPRHETADAAWCAARAEEVLARFSAIAEADIQPFTNDETDALAEQFLSAAASGGSFLTYRLDEETLYALFSIDDAVHAALEAEGLDARLLLRAAENVPSRLANPYGIYTSVANSTLSVLCTQDERCALPADFDGPYLVAASLGGGVYAAITLYDDGNNILGVSIAFLPDGSTLDALCLSLTTLP